jgi:hypothetical protein
MRKIDEQAKNAFMNRKKFKSSNTEVVVIDDLPHLYLHNNLIAKVDNNNDLLINHCGWETRTTSSRLNSLPGVKISVVKGDFIITKMGHMERMPKGWINVNKL